MSERSEARRAVGPGRAELSVAPGDLPCDLPLGLGPRCVSSGGAAGTGSGNHCSLLSLCPPTGPPPGHQHPRPLGSPRGMCPPAGCQELWQAGGWQLSTGWLLLNSSHCAREEGRPRGQASDSTEIRSSEGHEKPWFLNADIKSKGE